MYSFKYISLQGLGNHDSSEMWISHVNCHTFSVKILNWFPFVFSTVWDSDFFLSLRAVTCLRYDLFHVDNGDGFMRFLRSLTRKWMQMSTAKFELGSPIPHSVTLTVHPWYIESDTENNNLHVAKDASYPRHI